MAYDFGDGDLFAAGVNTEDEPDPRAGLVNLVDVMLVFACGLMLALVTYWNLDLPTVTQLSQNDMKPLDNAAAIVDAAASEGSYVERGRVYQDPKTGNLYWMEEVDDSATGGATATTGGVPNG